jgi:hypothetical protein
MGLYTKALSYLTEKSLKISSSLFKKTPIEPLIGDLSTKAENRVIISVHRAMRRLTGMHTVEIKNGQATAWKNGRIVSESLDDIQKSLSNAVKKLNYFGYSYNGRHWVDNYGVWR